MEEVEVSDIKAAVSRAVMPMVDLVGLVVHLVAEDMVVRHQEVVTRGTVVVSMTGTLNGRAIERRRVKHTSFFCFLLLLLPIPLLI